MNNQNGIELFGRHIGSQRGWKDLLGNIPSYNNLIFGIFTNLMKNISKTKFKILLFLPKTLRLSAFSPHQHRGCLWGRELTAEAALWLSFCHRARFSEEILVFCPRRPSSWQTFPDTPSGLFHILFLFPLLLRALLHRPPLILWIYRQAICTICGMGLPVFVLAWEVFMHLFIKYTLQTPPRSPQYGASLSQAPLTWKILPLDLVISNLNLQPTSWLRQRYPLPLTVYSH